MSKTDTSSGASGRATTSGSTAAEPRRRAEAPSSGSTGSGPTPDGDESFRFERDPAPSQPARRDRARKWDRPPPPRDWRWYVGNLGKVLIAIGLLMFGFVGYQLYGTGIETAAAQNALEDDFAALLAQTAPIDAPGVASNGEPTEPTGTDDGPVDTADVAENGTQPAVAAPIEPATPTEAVVPVEDQNLPSLENGEALARIEIPRIGVDDIVVAGVETGDLKKGPGHFPDTPLPGQLGNSAIAGHRTTYGQPFRNVDKLDVGDEIRVTTLSGVYVYRVTGQQIVSPSDYQVVATTDPTRANLTLTSCHPVFTARERIVTFSELAYTESAPVGEPILNYGRPSDPVDETPVDDGTATGTDDDPSIAAPPSDGSFTEDEPSAIDRLGTEAVNEGIADAFSEGWFSDPGANSHVGLWGAALAGVALVAYFISRRFRRDWIGLAIGLLPFVVTLYFFFQNVNRLLPPNL